MASCQESHWLIESLKIIQEQAGFRPGKSCAGQLLNLTEHIEDGLERELITGAVFVDLSAAYDTVNHRSLLAKLLEMTGDLYLTDRVCNMLDNLRLFVVLDGMAKTTKRVTSGKHTGANVVQYIYTQMINLSTSKFAASLMQMTFV